MTLRISIVTVLVIGATAVFLAGCGRTSPTELWPPITDPLVFNDTFGSHVGFQAFMGSKLDAVAVDSTVKYQGATSLKITVPPPADPSGGYAGGAFVTTMARDLSGYNALSFWVKASRPVPLEVAGLGNDNTGTSKYEAKRTAIPLTTSWAEVLVPIPLPSVLQGEKGLFFFAEGPQSGAGLTLWIDEVRFVNVGTVTDPRPAITTQTLNTLVGSHVSLQGVTKTVFSVGGADHTVAHMPSYFTFASSDPLVASVADGELQVLASGSTTVTAKLGAVDASGAITLNATAPPTVAAPTPSLPASDVISLCSNAYTDVPVDTWSANWDQADLADITIAGNAVKVYTNMVYAGIEFTTNPIDATAMTHFHLDVWVPGGTTFRVKLVDFGADGAYGGGDDSESELTFNASSAPALVTGSWVGLEIPLENFTGLAARARVAQLILSGDTKTTYVDNVYFHK